MTDERTMILAEFEQIVVERRALLARIDDLTQELLDGGRPPMTVQDEIHRAFAAVGILNESVDELVERMKHIK